MPTFEQPTCLTLVLCLGARAEGPGTFSLYGAFAGLISKDLPLALRPLGVYGVFSNVRRSVRLTAQLKFDPGGQRAPIVVAGPVLVTLTTISPLQRTAWALEIPDVRLPEYGDYSFTIEAGGRVIGEQRFALSKEGRA